MLCFRAMSALAPAACPIPLRRSAISRRCLSSADIAFVNLEAPFSDHGRPVEKGMVFKAEPDMIEALRVADIDGRLHGQQSRARLRRLRRRFHARLAGQERNRRCRHRPHGRGGAPEAR